MWGEFPRPPMLVQRLYNHELSKWASVYMLLYPTLGNMDHTLTGVAVACLFAIRHALDKGQERYYHNMHLDGEPNVEGRTIF